MCMGTVMWTSTGSSMKEKNGNSLTGVTFTGNVTFNGPMFDIHDNEHVHIGVEGVENNMDVNKELNRELLAHAIVKCQQYFWANSSYAVVFCVCRDAYKMQANKTAFEKMIEQLPYQGKRDFRCPQGTIANAFSDNQIYNENSNDWEQYNPLPRIIKLRDELRKELKL